MYYNTLYISVVYFNNRSCKNKNITAMHLKTEEKIQCRIEYIFCYSTPLQLINL